MKPWSRNLACVLPLLLLLHAQTAAADNDDGIVLKLTPALARKAAPPQAAAPANTLADTPWPGLRPALELAVTIPAAAALPPAQHYDQLVVSVRVNSVAKGDFLGYIGANQDFLFAPADLPNMEITDTSGRVIEIGGERFVSLKSFPGIQLKFNDNTLSLDIVLPASMLPKQQMNLGASQPFIKVQPRAPGGFLNYRLGYADAIHSNGTLSGATELGANLGEMLFLNTHDFSVGNGQNHAVRLQTQLIYDQPDDLRRFVAGDQFASSGDLGSTLNLGGFGVSKVYQINPYFLKQPLVGFAGAVASPSIAEVYIDGARVTAAKLAPGTFNLQSLNFINGLHNVDLVIRDQFGGEQHVSFPYFFNDQLLAKGLQEYSYNIGFMRNNYGVASFDYGKAAASAFHRYGVSDALTIGAGADMSPRHLNLGPRALFNSGPAGIFSLGVSWSHDSTGTITETTLAPDGTLISTPVTAPGSGALTGNATSLGYTYIKGAFSLQAAARRFSENYTLLGFAGVGQPKLQESAAISYGTRNAGTATLGRSVQTVYGGSTDQKATSLSYSRTLGSNLSLIASLTKGSQATPNLTITSATGFDVTRGTAAMISLSYFSSSGTSANLSQQKNINGDTSTQMQVAKTTPLGEGWGYRFLGQRNVTGGVPSEAASPYVQYNARNAIFIAEGNSTSSAGANSSSYQLSVAGAAVYIGGAAYLSRPVDDGYGLVKIEPPIPGVRVYKSSALIGATDDTGMVFIPNLGSYQSNSVEIQPKDLPLDVSVPSAKLLLRPPLRGGGIATFPVKKVRAVTGRMMVRGEGADKPLDDYEFVLEGGTPGVHVRTVRGGDFYLENLTPGNYTAELKVGENVCKLVLTVPDSQEVIADIGEVICELVP